MQRFQFYLPEGHVSLEADLLAERILALPGTALEPGDGYRPGTWSAAATGARAVLDVGDPPIEEDLQHPPRVYAGWLALPLAVQVPLVGPHWQAVEAFQFIEGILAALPRAARALDCEDTKEGPDAEHGPFAWSRPRALASWERLHEVQVGSRTDLARMHRGDSLRLWRWRRERADAQAAHPGLLWPEARVLKDRATGSAQPTAVWTDPARPVALPGAGLVLAMLPGRPLLLRRGDLPPGDDLGAAGAARVEAPAAWPDGLPAERFAACQDEDWID